MQPMDPETLREALSRIPDPIAFLHGLFAYAPVAFQLYEPSGHSVLVNPAFRQLFGSEPPKDYNVLRDEIAARNGVLGIIHRAFAGETVTVPPTWYDPRELRQVRVEEGNRVAVVATFFPILDAGRVTHVGVVFRDVTAETRAREALEAERELLAMVIEQTADGIVMADESGCVRLVNEAARRIGVHHAGLPLKEWTRTYPLEHADGTPLRLTEYPLFRALHGERFTSVVYVPSGSGRRAVVSSAVPLRLRDGTTRGAVTTLRDETERLEREEEQTRTALFRERFIGIVGHDLRSPLGAISANAGLILRHPELPEAIAAAAARTASTAMRMGRMISDLLDFTQARLGGGLVIQRKPCDLVELAKSAIDEAIAANPGRSAKLVADGPIEGSFDRDRVAQLLSNLLQNALAYSAPGSGVEVRLGVDGAAVEIAVANRGPAIAPDELRRLFDPFERGSAAGGSRGLGLGLYIVQQIAEAHQGSVAVSSDARETVFRARLQR